MSQNNSKYLNIRMPVANIYFDFGLCNMMDVSFIWFCTLILRTVKLILKMVSLSLCLCVSSHLFMALNTVDWNVCKNVMDGYGFAFVLTSVCCNLNVRWRKREWYILDTSFVKHFYAFIAVHFGRWHSVVGSCFAIIHRVMLQSAC
jgi:hypothetical protein